MQQWLHCQQKWSFYSHISLNQPNCLPPTEILIKCFKMNNTLNSWYPWLTFWSWLVSSSSTRISLSLVRPRYWFHYAWTWWKQVKLRLNWFLKTLKSLSIWLLIVAINKNQKLWRRKLVSCLKPCAITSTAQPPLLQSSVATRSIKFLASQLLKRVFGAWKKIPSWLKLLLNLLLMHVYSE